MTLKILVETGFLLALNPRDRHHRWALKILEKARRRVSMLYVSPVAPIELSLIMKSKGYDEESILRVLSALHSIITRYTKPNYPSLKLEHVMYATELRMRYPELTFFDSMHASIAISNNLVYNDLDEVVSNVIQAELKSKE